MGKSARSGLVSSFMEGWYPCRARSDGSAWPEVSPQSCTPQICCDEVKTLEEFSFSQCCSHSVSLE